MHCTSHCLKYLLSWENADSCPARWRLRQRRMLGVVTAEEETMYPPALYHNCDPATAPELNNLTLYVISQIHTKSMRIYHSILCLMHTFNTNCSSHNNYISCFSVPTAIGIKDTTLTIRFTQGTYSSLIQVLSFCDPSSTLASSSQSRVYFSLNYMLPS